MKSLSQKPVSVLFHQLAFVLLVGILIFGCSRSQTGDGSSSSLGGSNWGDEPGGDLLWSVDRLHSEIYLDAPELVIVDCRLEVSDFDSGHILDAIWINYYDMSGDPPISFAPTLLVENYLGGDRGIEITDTIVIYGDGSLGLNAPYRLFWLLEYYGCQDVHIVDGGLKAWNAKKYPLDMTSWAAIEPTIVPATFDAVENPSVVAEIQDIENFIEFHASTNEVLVDARAPWEFTGEACYRAQDRSGHIPYSKNAWSYAAFSKETGLLKSPNTVRTLLADVGAVLGKDVISVSLWGRRSAASYFLCRLLGYSCRVYQEGLTTFASVDTPPLQPVEREGAFLHKSLLKNLERAEFGGASAVYKGRIFCFGGIWFDEAAEMYRVSIRAWSFEPSTDPVHEGIDDTCWDQLPYLPQPRFGMSAAATPDQDAIFLFGGADGGGNVNSDILRCDINPVTLKVTGVSKVQQLNDSLYGAACVYNDADGLIYIIGGSMEIPPSGAVAEVYSFDPVTYDLTALAPLPSPRLRSGAVALDGKIYVMGGEALESGKLKVLSGTLVFDPGSNSWTTLKSMATSRLGVKGAAAFGRIYMCGGFSYNSTDGMHTTGLVESYDPVSNTWRKEGEMLIPRFNHFMESVDDVVYLIGGYVGFPRYLADIENLINFPNVVAYRPDLAEKRSPLPAAQHGGATAVFNDKIYIFGGYENGALSSNVFEYDPAADTWLSMDPIPYGAVQGAGAVATGSGIIVFGGADELGTAVATAYSFDPTQIPNSQWTQQLADMPDARFAAAAVYDPADQTVYVIGGKNFTFCLDSTLSYDVTGDLWDQEPLSLPTARGWSAAALINGMIFLAGGVGNDGVPLPDTLVCDAPNPIAWTFYTAMPTARYGQGSTVIGNRMYNVGGYILDGLMPDVTSAIEIFDPARGRWTSRPGMADAKALTFTAAASNASGGTSLFVIGGTALSPSVNYADTIEIAP